jgi:hypothetical protein
VVDSLVSDPQPAVNGRLLLALDDFINPKTGKKIFACASFFDHAAKINQPKYAWSQNVVSIGLLKVVKGRWACLPLAFSFYHMKKTIDEDRVEINSKSLPFKTKFEQAVEMLFQISEHFANTPLLAVTDSWFGSDGLFKPMRKTVGPRCHILSRFRVNASLFELPKRVKGQVGRPKKYGRKLGCAISSTTQKSYHALLG